MFRILFSAIVLLLFTTAPATAAPETVPGNACGTAPFITNVWQWAGATQNGGVLNGMFCNGSTWTGVINFQSTGYVGLGTTTPAAMLDVEQVGAAPLMRVYSAVGSTYFSFDNSGKFNYNGVLGFAWDSAGSHTALTTWSGSDLYLTTNGVSGSNNNIIIYPNGTGKVGIGTTSPSVTLEVAGDIKYSGLLTDTSDRRLKDNIAPLGPQLGKITSLQPVSFTMKEDKKHRTELGLIAQDTESIYPDLVFTAPDGTKSLAYTGLIAPLIEAAKEEQAEINQLRAMLAAVFLGGLFLFWRTRTK